MSVSRRFTVSLGWLSLSAISLAGAAWFFRGPPYPHEICGFFSAIFLKQHMAEASILAPIATFAPPALGLYLFPRLSGLGPRLVVVFLVALNFFVALEAWQSATPQPWGAA